MLFNELKTLLLKYPLVKKALSPLITVKQSLFKSDSNIQKEFLKDLYDVLIEDPLVRVDEFNGTFRMSAKSDLLHRIVVEKRYEPEIAEYCARYVDTKKDVIDIGANIGFYTVMFAKMVESNVTVHAIEPSMMARKRLIENIEINKVSNCVKVFGGAISNIIGTVDLHTVDGKEEYSSLGQMSHAAISKDVFTSHKVESVTLDEFIRRESVSPGFIKMDVEGVEHLVFEGAEHTLEKHRPIIMSEIDDHLLENNGSSANFVVQMIKDKDYLVFDPKHPDCLPGTNSSNTMLCLPKERGV